MAEEPKKRNPRYYEEVNKDNQFERDIEQLYDVEENPGEPASDDKPQKKKAEK